MAKRGRPPRGEHADVPERMSVRLTTELLSQLKGAADEHSRSLTQEVVTRLFDSSEYQLRVGYQLSNFLFIETFTDQISERPQNGLDLKLKFRFR